MIFKSAFIFLAGLLLFNGKAHAQTQPSHTVILILENRRYDSVAGNPGAPYINSLLSGDHTAKFTQSYALTHPSQPNYIMLFSGASQGITDDEVPPGLPFTTPNLGASLLQAGLTFIGYSEDLPSVGYTGKTSGAYVRKHNPWVNWQEAPVNGIPASANRPFSDFPSDFNLLPDVSIVVPNLNHDAHDSDITHADPWIQNNLGPYIEWSKTHNSLFILTFDEDDFKSTNQILTFLTGENVIPGSYSQRITHYNVLRTIEDLYGLPRIGASADSSAIQNIWFSTLPVKFVNFTAASLLNTVLLKWQTSEEYNAKEFAVERSANKGQSWQALAVVPAAGNTTTLQNYSYTDVHPVSGLNLYRIKEVDLNNSFTYSEMATVLMPEEKVQYKTYPNPAANCLYVATAKTEQVTISLMDASGRQMIQKRSVIKTDAPASIDLSPLRAGIYFIEISNGPQKTMERIIINHY